MALPKEFYAKFENPDQLHLIAYRGSITHGMYRPNTEPNSIDDKDVMGVIIPPADHYFGLKEYGSRGTREFWVDEYDVVVYEFKKFVSLLAKGNPNILSILWLDPNHYIRTMDAAITLIENRDLFVGKHVFHSFSGYAYAQLYKMTHLACEGYMGAKRKRLVEKYGYDTKNAAHLIRLLRMGIEFLNDGEMQVMRPDAQQLLEIKAGEWSLEQVKAESDILFKRCADAYDRSKLPPKPDMDKINQLMVDILAGEV